MVGSNSSRLALRQHSEDAAGSDDSRFKTLVTEAYGDLSKSVEADGGAMSPFAEAYKDVKALICDGELNIQCVNSDVQLEPILDPETAELRSRTKANLFIGGSILDRKRDHDQESDCLLLRQESKENAGGHCSPAFTGCMVPGKIVICSHQVLHIQSRLR